MTRYLPNSAMNEQRMATSSPFSPAFRRWLMLCASAFFLVLVSIAHAQNFEADNLLNFARSLFREGDYAEAVHEFKRYQFLYPNAPQNDFAQMHIAAAHQNMGQFDSAIAAYRSLIADYPDSPFVERSKSNIAQCQLLQGDRPKAISSLEKFVNDYPDSELAPRAQFLIGTVYMDERKWTEAAQAWRRVQIRYAQTPFGELSDQLTRMVARVDSLPHRSPTLGGFMSAVVPGLGQAYSGRVSDALYTFWVVGLTAGGTAYYIDKERYAVAIPVGIVSLFFYLGNIYGGVQAAKGFNARETARFLDELRTTIQASELFGARWSIRF